MTPRAVPPPDVAYRLGRRPDPWAWPSWAYATDGGTFGSRYDDPLGAYRVLYASTQRLGCFLETLARFRPDPAVVAELREIEGDDDTLAAGTVPASWLDDRCVGRAGLTGVYCDIGHSQSLAWLRDVVGADIDAAAIRRSVPRAFTQAVGRRIYELADGRGGSRFAGVRYGSRLGDEIVNWAVFEPAELLDPRAEPLAREDPDLDEALLRFGLTMA
jgi:RES domain